MRTYVPAVNLPGGVLVDWISWRKIQLFFSQIPQRRGEERSGNFVGVGGHTNVGINDGPKKENRIGSAEISVFFFKLEEVS